MNRYAEYTDEALLSLLKDGESDVFAALYDRHWKGVHKYLRTCVRDDEQAKDLLQDVFYSLWKKRETLVIRSSIQDYIYRIAKNRVLTYYSSDSVRKKYEEHFTHFEAAYDNGNEETASLHDLEASIERSISQLPKQCQTAFRLSRYENVPIAEIAQRMNISKRTAENYITTALKHLRGSLGEFMILMVWLEMWE